MLAILGCATGQRVSSHLPSRHACGVSVTKTLALTALPASPVSITGPTSVCPSQAGLVYTTPAVTGVTQQWALPTGGVITAGQGTTSMTGTWGTVAGSVTVRSINACGQSGTRGLAVSLLTCMGQAPNDDNTQRTSVTTDILRIFPNPSQGDVTIQTIGMGWYTCYDASGRVVRSQFVNDQANTPWHLTDLADGMYLIDFIDLNGIRIANQCFFVIK
ncbi:MAG: T9SS type A sorting domain-containing protein [Flavobacteriales bacterium]